MGATGTATALFLKERGARVTVSDIRSEEELLPTLNKLKNLGIPVETKEHRQETCIGSDLIVVSPGVPLVTPALKAAGEAGVEIISEIELAYRHITTPIIAVTGTNGKTTTVNLIADIFESSGKPVFLGGNVGTPLIEYVLHRHDEPTIIAEISSFQLEGIQRFKPYISALLNLQQDHLDRYPSYEEYVAAKARIFMNQSSSEYAVLNADDADVKKLTSSIHAATFYFYYEKEVPYGIYSKNHHLYLNNGSGQIQLTLDNPHLRGIHNLTNTMAAVAISKICGCPPEAIQKTINHFKGLPHRLECFQDCHGIKFYNDSKATNVGSTASALQALNPPIILIAGGKDKGCDYHSLTPLVRKKVKALILLGEAKEKMQKAFQSTTSISLVETLEDAVQRSFKKASPGDSILLSPACSSFDMFQNYEERGNRFKTLVNQLTGK